MTDPNPASSGSDFTLRRSISVRSISARNLDEVPENLNAMLFELRRICPTWENCLAFLNGGGFDQHRLVAFLESLLRTKISDERKASVIGLMDLDAVVGLPDRAALVGSILDRTSSGLSKVNARVARSLITHSAPIATQISIMNKVSLVLTDDDVRQVLAVLPRPYSDIRTGYYTPTLSDDPDNRKLLGWLDSRNIISSWKVNKGFFSHDLRVNLRRR